MNCYFGFILMRICFKDMYIVISRVMVQITNWKSGFNLYRVPLLLDV